MLNIKAEHMGVNISGKDRRTIHYILIVYEVYRYNSHMKDIVQCSMIRAHKRRFLAAYEKAGYQRAHSWTEFCRKLWLGEEDVHMESTSGRQRLWTRSEDSLWGGIMEIGDDLEIKTEH